MSDAGLARAGRLVPGCVRDWPTSVPGSAPGSVKTKGGGRSRGRRFTSALDAIKSDDPRARFLGRTVLAELAGSELASAEERSLADVVFIEDDDHDDHDGSGGGGSI